VTQSHGAFVGWIDYAIKKVEVHAVAGQPPAGAAGLRGSSANLMARPVT
jgi:hypothetical protein